MPRDEANLLDVVQFARQIIEFTDGLNEEEFVSDVRTQYAVLHSFTLLGESVRRLSEATRARAPAVPWSSVIGMRNKLVHAYDAVDLHLVWQTATRIVPRFLEAVRDLTPAVTDQSADG